MQAQHEPLEEKIVALFARLIDLMDKQANDAGMQSFGSLSYHRDAADRALKAARYRNPLYHVALPRWLGEYANTEIEEQISVLASEIDGLVVDLNGGADAVNHARAKHNESSGF